MSTEPVLIEDDDVDMEPVVILDEDVDKMDSEVIMIIPTVETIDLDPDDDTPIDNNKKSVTENVKDAVDTKISLNKSELSFIQNLKTNKLMDQIVNHCLNMQNAVGMTRVINKTVIPLYRDANVSYKQSGTFRKLLKNTLKSLIRDPDHKFLHVKTLCEELKSGGLRRKVPFVTLTTNLRYPSEHVNGKEIQSRTRVTPETQNHFSIQHNRTTENSNKITKYISKKNSQIMGAVKKKTKIYGNILKSHSMQTRMHSRNLKENTDDVINLDNSDNESIISIDNDEDKNVTAVIEGKEIKHNHGDSKQSNVKERDQETDDFNENIQTHNTYNSNTGNVEEKAQEAIVGNKRNTTVEIKQEPENCSIENEKLTNENHNMADDSLDFDLLIPQCHVEVVMENTVASTPNLRSKRVDELEQKIALYKKVITQLEETEVSSDNQYSSPYVYCARLKKQVVQLYKQLCKINGYCEDIVKRREIRLHVAEGHPPGPAKQLEKFLNSTIDSTGSVAFPDFADVAKCVVEANVADDLGWDTQRMFREASALFRQCGQALRKRRQKREYRDLLSLVKEEELTDDPAEKYPSLLAKLEENKRIAKAKEEHIIERYVNMEQGGSYNGRVNNIATVQFETNQDSTDSESDSEPNDAINNLIKAASLNMQCITGESSKTNIISNNLDVRLSNNISTTLNSKGTTSINNIMTTTINNLIGAAVNSSFEMGESSNNTIIRNNNACFTAPNNYIVMPPLLNYQYNVGESSAKNDDFSYYYVVPANNSITNVQSKAEQCSNNSITSSNNLYLTITPANIGNIQTTPNMGNFQAIASIGNIPTTPNIANIQTTPNIANIQLTPNIGNIPTRTNIANIQPTPNIAIIQPTPNIGNIPTRTNVANIPPKPNIVNILPKPNIGNIPTRPNIANILPTPNIGNIATRPNIANIQPTPNIGNIPTRTNIVNIQPTANIGNVLTTANMANIPTMTDTDKSPTTANNANIQPTAHIGNVPTKLNVSNIHTTENIMNITHTTSNIGNITQTTAISDNDKTSGGNNNVISQNPVLGLPTSPCIKNAQNCIPCPTNDLDEHKSSSAIEPNSEVKLEAQVKKEPIDVQSMLDELGDNFVCTVFDVEDPFLVIEISSDGFSDDD